MPYVKLITGDIFEVAENKFNGIKKTGKINPFAVHYDGKTGVGFVGSHIVAMYRDNPAQQLLVGSSVTPEFVEKAEAEIHAGRKPGRPPKAK